MDGICKRCGVGFVCHNGPRPGRIYCSDRCGRLANNALAQGVRSVATQAARQISRNCEHCKIAFTSSGKRGPTPRFCSIGCKDESNLLRRFPRTERQCVTCNVKFVTSPKRMYCSDECRRKGQPLRMLRVVQRCDICYGDFDRSEYSKCETCPKCRPVLREIAEEVSMYGTKLDCPGCGRCFQPMRKTQTHCSRVCLHRQAGRKKRAVMKRAYIEDVDFAVLYQRDGGKCGICGEHVALDIEHPDPKSPSIDHKVPLSRGGEHSYANTQVAHFGCNSSKGAKVETPAA